MLMRKILLGSWLLSVLFCLPLLAQDRVIDGKVTSSEDGTSLPGVNVSIKGTTRGFNKPLQMLKEKIQMTSNISF